MVSYVVLYCNRFIILFTQINTLKKKNKENIFNLTVHYLEKYNSTTAGTEGHIRILESLKLDGLCVGDLV